MLLLRFLPPEAQDLIFTAAPECYHLGDPGAECGNQEPALFVLTLSFEDSCFEV